MMTNSQAVLTNLNHPHAISRERPPAGDPDYNFSSPVRDRSRINSPSAIQEFFVKNVIAPLMGMLIVQLPEDLGPGQGD